jgi:uracil phosphoribosyltransferase
VSSETCLETQYSHLPRPCGELEHGYGPSVHIHAQPWSHSLLARLCAPETTQPTFNQILTSIYRFLVTQVVNAELGTEVVERATRMQRYNPEAILRTERVDPRQQVVLVDVARAGILPSAIFFDELHNLLDPDVIRQDHVFMNRATNEKGEVVGVNLHGSKIGGPVAGRLVIIPDPMGATGSSLLRVMDLYRNQAGGAPLRFVAVHLILTPEYLARVVPQAPDLQIHCVRVDRGLSSPEILATRHGERWSEERGLNDEDYIVPGGGGFGELINNALT